MKKEKKLVFGVLEFLGVFIFVGFLLGPYMWRVVFQDFFHSQPEGIVCSFPETPLPGPIVKMPPPPPPSILEIGPSAPEDLAQMEPSPIIEIEVPPHKPDFMAIEEVRDNLHFEPDSLDADLKDFDVVKYHTGCSDGYDGDFIIHEPMPQPLNKDLVCRLIGYPQLARDAGIMGTVVLRVLVNKQGEYVRHVTKASPHPILTRCVEEHISKLMFEPATCGGKAIYSWVNIPFRFHTID